MELNNNLNATLSTLGATIGNRLEEELPSIIITFTISIHSSCDYDTNDIIFCPSSPCADDDYNYASVALISKLRDKNIWELDDDVFNFIYDQLPGLSGEAVYIDPVCATITIDHVVYSLNVDYDIMLKRYLKAVYEDEYGSEYHEEWIPIIFEQLGIEF